MSSRRRAEPEAAPQSLANALSSQCPFINSQTPVNVKANTVEVKDGVAGNVEAIIDGDDIDMKFKLLSRTKKMKSMSILSMDLNSSLWTKHSDWLNNRIFVLYGGRMYVTASDEMSPIATISDGYNTFYANKVSVVPEDKGGTIEAMIQYLSLIHI